MNGALYLNSVHNNKLSNISLEIINDSDKHLNITNKDNYND